MILIENVLIARDVISSDFACKISACKGVCCEEGDYGAPMEAAEIDALKELLDDLKDYLPRKSIEYLKVNEFWSYYPEIKKPGTPLHEDGSCIYAVKDDKGILHCAIELAWRDGKTSFRKPVSCQLYPIRVKTHPENGMEFLIYDKWEICSPACKFGKENSIPLYVFLKDALIRKYGKSFYKQLEETIIHLKSE